MDEKGETGGFDIQGWIVVSSWLRYHELALMWFYANMWNDKHQIL